MTTVRWRIETYLEFKQFVHETYRIVDLPSSTYSQQVSRLFIFTWSHSDTPHSVGLLWTRDRPVAEASTWQHTTLTRDKKSMPPLGFEPTIPTSARPQTYALDRAATGIGFMERLRLLMINCTTSDYNSVFSDLWTTNWKSPLNLQRKLRYFINKV
jgi:hypothetical protein